MENGKNALRLGVVLLAAGKSERFGGNKLLAGFAGRPVVGCAMDAVSWLEAERTAVVTGNDEVSALAKTHGFKAVIAPLRPSEKRFFRDMDIKDYIAMRKPGTDLPFDPWIRLHVKLGARIIKPCLESVVISEPLEKWTQWTGVTFDKSGLYSIPGGDEPLVVDVEENQGDYSASGVWVVHEIE